MKQIEPLTNEQINFLPSTLSLVCLYLILDMASYQVGVLRVNGQHVSLKDVQIGKHCAAVASDLTLADDTRQLCWTHATGGGRRHLARAGQPRGGRTARSRRGSLLTR